MIAPLPPLLLKGDCLVELARIPDASVDSIVTDPPYGLGFMGKGWDIHTPLDFERFCEAWSRECLRILKPGGHMLAFGGSRTWHRLAAGIEDAGFEIRDSIAWLYGSGFPKSMDVSKAIDKAAGATREVVGVNSRAAQQTPKHDDTSLGKFAGTSPDLTAPATDAAREWEGWGTALKPAFEPIVVARKPLGEKTVAANVLAYGTGALNIDATRIGVTDAAYARNHSGDRGHAGTRSEDRSTDIHAGGGSASAAGRWPANVVLDEDQAAALDAQSGVTKSTRGKKQTAGAPTAVTTGATHGGSSGGYNHATRDEVVGHSDSGGASRFFYIAKAPKSERPVIDGTAHPTVKPLSLMRWLIRLVTPPGGCVVDPFAGSGTTLEAAYLEGFESIGVEMTPDYWPLIAARIERVTS